MTKCSLIAFFLAFAFQAHSLEISKQNIVQTDNPYEVQFSKEENIADKKIQRFRQILNQVNGFLGELEAPKNVKINLYGTHGQPAAAMHSPEISIGFQYSVRSAKQPDKIYTKNPIYTEAIFAHEYGHLIFKENYIKLEPLLKKSEEAYLALIESQKESALIDEKIQTIQDKTAGASRKERKSLRAEIRKLQEEQMQIQQEGLSGIEEADRIDSVIVPYNEFFADVVAVLQVEKPDAISNALTFTSKNQNVRGQAQRKFGQNSRNFKNNISHMQEMEAHHFFSMTRSYLWAFYLASPRIMKNNKSKVLSAVFMAVAKEASRQLQKGLLTLPDWKESNENLIASIEFEMKLRGLDSLK